MRRRYVFAGIATAVPVGAGAYVAWRQLAGDDPRTSAARRFETSYDAAAKALAAAPAVADAISRADARTLETVLLPLQVAHKIDLVDVMRADGEMLLALRADRYRDRALRMIDSETARWPIVSAVLAAKAPSIPAPSPAAVIRTSWGDAVYRALPVAQNGHVVGAILIGTPLDEALRR